MQWDSLLKWVAIAGAIGTAAMGLVEACKAVSLPTGGRRLSLATIGLGTVLKQLGEHVQTALKGVYGEGGDTVVIEGAWRKGPEEVEKVLRDGLRLAVFCNIPNLEKLLTHFGESEPEGLITAIKQLKEGEGSASPQVLAAARSRLGRFESVVDVRVRAAVASGRDAYISSMQALACVVAIVSSLATVWAGIFPVKGPLAYAYAGAIGALAVPIAPVAKDVATFLNGVRNAFTAKKSAAP